MLPALCRPGQRLRGPARRGVARRARRSRRRDGTRLGPRSISAVAPEVFTLEHPDRVVIDLRAHASGRRAAPPLPAGVGHARALRHAAGRHAAGRGRSCNAALVGRTAPRAPAECRHRLLLDLGARAGLSRAGRGTAQPVRAAHAPGEGEPRHRHRGGRRARRPGSGRDRPRRHAREGRDARDRARARGANQRGARHAAPC